MTVASLRAAMGTALRTVDGLSNVSDYMTDQINPPHAMFDFAVEPHRTFGSMVEGGAVFRFTVQVFASRSDDTTGQRLLDKMRDPTSTGSLAYVIENDSTLAGACDYARVSSIGAIQIANPSPNVEYLMIPIEVEVVV